jgi:hypothetical protein
MAWLADTPFYRLEPCVDGMKLSARAPKATAFQLSRVETARYAEFRRPAEYSELFSQHIEIYEFFAKLVLFL